MDARVRRWPRVENTVAAPVVADVQSPLWFSDEAGERWHQAGKVHNLRIAARCLNGVEIPAGEMFSFWTQLGRSTRWRGYTFGREVREGCLIPSVGGGLCQLSNALYQAALQAGCEIIERHAHTQAVPGSAAARGQDATVFWNYVDLRFRAPHRLRIEASLSRDTLTLRFTGQAESKIVTKESGKGKSIPLVLDSINDCASCGQHECVQHAPQLASHLGTVAVLVDAYWPEFDDYLQRQDTRGVLLLPLDGRRYRKPNYAWTIKGYAQARQHFASIAWRSWRSRSLADQGAQRQFALLQEQTRLARRYVRRLGASVDRLIVQQGLLPYLWQSGELGGRHVTVMLERLPIRLLHARLDRLAARHPQSPTAADFRAPDAVAQSEWEALVRADRIVTPHAELAGLFPDKTERLPWNTGVAGTWIRNDTGPLRLLFPASTVARKGAYELRAATQDLDCELLVFPGNHEDLCFWYELSAQVVRRNAISATPIDVVVLPAWVEFQPRLLLRALASGIPVVTTPAAGVSPQPGLELCEIGDDRGLAICLHRLHESRSARKTAMF